MWRKLRFVMFAMAVVAWPLLLVNGCAEKLPTEGEVEATELPQEFGNGPFPMGYPQYCFYLNVPWMSQLPPGTDWTTNNCGQACCAMLGGYFNHGSTQSWVIDAENDFLHCARPYGCEIGAGTLQYLLREFHALNSSYYHGNGADDVVMEGAHGRPVIVGVRTYMSTNGRPHWMLFIGWDGTYMYFNDPGRSTEWGPSWNPWSRGRYRCTPSKFYSSWNSFPGNKRQYIPVRR
ncbi:MAG: C39 family peptidase [bacterium]